MYCISVVYELKTSFIGLLKICKKRVINFDTRFLYTIFVLNMVITQ
jgi:hypothetical protein